MSSPCSCRGCTEAYNAGRVDAAAAIFAATSYRPLIEWQEKLTAIAQGEPLKHINGADIIQKRKELDEELPAR